MPEELWTEVHDIEQEALVKTILKKKKCKKAKWFSEQSLQISEKVSELIWKSNRMGKIRDLFKKIRETKGTFHAKMGSIKDINGMDLIEAEDIKKRWQEYTEELYKEDLHDPGNHDGVITHLEPDILDVKPNQP